jgi:hypothetical protein
MLKMHVVLTFLHLDAAPSATKGTLKCPYNESEWQEKSAGFHCQGKDVYHCFLAEDKNFVKEGCIERTMILKGTYICCRRAISYQRALRSTGMI